MRFLIIYGLSVYSIICSFVVAIPIFILFLEEPFQLGYYFPFIMLKSSNVFLAVIVSTAVNIWWTILIWRSYLLTFHINLAFMHTFKTTIIYLISSNNLKNSNGNGLVKLQNTLFIYSKLRILTTIFNSVYGTLYVPPVKSLFGSTIILTTLLAIRLATKDDVAVRVCGVSMFFCVTAILTIFITFTAMVNEWSRKLENFLRKRQEVEIFSSKLSRRLLRAFEVEAVKSGGFYEITKLTCLTVLGLISNMTGSVVGTDVN